MRTLPCVGLAVLVLGPGCRRSAPAPPRAPAAALAHDAAPPATPPPPPPAAPLSESEARAVLARWLDAQNRGDFDGYAALYASRFHGVKRVGARTREFDRGRWLADRQPMFRGGAQVAIDAVHVTTTRSTAVLHFTQTFTAGSFRDVGPKQLVLVREGGALRIAGEEMLRSELLAAPGAAAPPTPEQFMLVLRAGGPRLVLHAAPEEGWSAGALEVVSGNDEVVAVRQPAADAALPAGLRALRGRAVRLYGPDGAVCTARVGALSVLRRVDVHFTTQAHWAGGDGSPPATPAQIAQEAWSLADAGATLVGDVEAPQGDCARALWARAAALPAPLVYVPAAAPEALAEQLDARFRQLPAWRALQEEYRRSPQASPGADWTPPAAVQLWEHAPSGRRFATLAADVHEGGCADFSGRLWAAFDVSGARPVLRSGRNGGGFFAPQAAVDLDGDGTPEFVTPDGLIAASGGVFGLIQSLEYAQLDCPC